MSFQVSELDGHVVECALDTHGSWGVCIAFKQTHAPFVLVQMSKHMLALTTQQHGIRVVQQAAAPSVRTCDDRCCFIA